MWIHIGIIWAWSCQEWSKVARPWSSLHLNFGPSSHYESCLGPSMCLVTEKFVCLEIPREVLKHLVLWATHAVGARLVWVWKVESLCKTNFLSVLKWFGDARGWWTGEPEAFSGWTSIYRIYRLFMAVLWCLHMFFIWVYQGTRLTHSHLAPSGLWFLNLLQIGCLEPAWCGNSVAWKCIANGQLVQKKNGRAHHVFSLIYRVIRVAVSACTLQFSSLMGCK